MSEFDATNEGHLAAREIEAIKLYLLLMQEAKARLLLVDQTIQNEGDVPPWMVKEICHLQFRYLSEIIALACLSAHGDLRLKNALSKEYKPRHIFKKLEELKPFFFPEPIKRTQDGNQKVFETNQDIPAITKAELLGIWKTDLLHRGSIAQVYAPERTSADFEKLPDINLRFAGLLASHWITLVTEQKGMHVRLISEDGMPQIDVLDFGTENGAPVRCRSFASDRRKESRERLRFRRDGAY